MKPLEQIKVIDLTHVLAGPFCTYQLATLGAEVIKIESPSDPDMMRMSGPDYKLAAENMGLHFMAQNAGKKSLALDIKQPDGRKILESLVAQSDVLVENFRGGVMQSLQLGYAELKVINPRLIYCSMSGYGHTGPKAHHPAYDNVIQAYSGLMAATGSPETGPVKVGPPVLDYGTGAQAAMAITAALLQREATGAGQHIDVSMLDSALMLMASLVTETLYNGVSPELPGNSSASNAGYGVFQTKEGLLMIGAYTPKQLAAVWTVLGQLELAGEVVNYNYQDMNKGVTEQRVLLAELILERSAEDWEDLFNEHGVPAARVRTVDEALASQQVKSRQVIQSVAHPNLSGGTLSVPVAAFSFDQGGPGVERAPPVLSQDSHEILVQLGLTDKRISELTESGVIACPASSPPTSGMV